MEFKNLSTILAVARDTFKNGYKKLKEEKDLELKNAKNDFKGNRLLQEQQAIKSNFDKKVDELRVKIKSETMPAFEEIRNFEIAKATSINKETLNLLNAIKDLPLTELEITLLSEKYGGKNYYTDKMLTDMSIKNAVNTHNNKVLERISVDIGVKLDVVGNLEKQLDELLSTYDGELKYGNDVLLADAVLLKAEQKFNGGFLSSTLTPEEKAQRALTAIFNQQNEMQKAVCIANSVKNCDEMTQNYIIAGLLENALISDVAIELSGISSAVEKFDFEAFMQARKAFESIELINADKTTTTDKKEVDIAAILAKLSKNQYAEKMIENSKNQNVKNASELAKTVSL